MLTIESEPGRSILSQKAMGNVEITIPPAEVTTALEQHILVDGFKLVFDLEQSLGSHFVDAATGRSYIDLYGFYASQPIGFNHPHFSRPEVEADLLAAAGTLFFH